MLRRVVIGLLLLTSLVAQVSTAYACRIAGSPASSHCHCPQDVAPSASDPQPCCVRIAQIGDVLAVADRAQASVAILLPDLPPALPLGALPALLADVAPPRDATHPPPWLARPGGRVYLQTLRLRI